MPGYVVVDRPATFSLGKLEILAKQAVEMREECGLF